MTGEGGNHGNQVPDVPVASVVPFKVVGKGGKETTDPLAAAGLL